MKYLKKRNPFLDSKKEIKENVNDILIENVNYHKTLNYLRIIKKNLITNISKCVLSI